MSKEKFIVGDWGYDIETYPNAFTFAIISSDRKHKRCWEVSFRKDETQEILNCLRYLVQNNQRMIGFNNLGFDYPIIHKILEQAKVAKSGGLEYKIDYRWVYEQAMQQIQSARDGFASVVKREDEIIEQIDLFKINHFDNKARATSLKMLEFNMKSENIEDLPFPVGKELTSDEIDVLKRYNTHDVVMTLDFYEHNISAIRLREALSVKYGADFMNHNDTKIGKDYFILELEKHQKGICYEQTPFGRKMNQTKHKSIKIGECLFDYYDFTRPEFIALKDWFSKQVITETKGVFSDIEEHRLGDVAKYAEMVVKRVKFKEAPTEQDKQAFLKEHPLGWFEETPLKAMEIVRDENGDIVYEEFVDSKGVTKKRSVKRPKISHYGCYNVAETLNVVINGLRYDYGVGGIHASLQSMVVRETEDEMMRDADVASMYPNIGISNKVFPLHLGETFCTIYEDVYNQRKSFAKGTPENAVMKLALNGVYGDSNNEYSPFYDSSYTMKITVNGQLSLSLLIDKLLMVVPDIKVVQANTDGITCKFKREHEHLYSLVCSDWEKQVKLQLEYADYESMHIRDVNSYVAMYTNGKVKYKGAYVHDDLGWHQNHSSKVVQMAAGKAMLEGVSVEDFIRNHDNKFDFMLRTKVPRSSRLVLEVPLDEDSVEEIPQQNICRYYASVNGGKLVKIMPPLDGKEDERRMGIESSWNVMPCNDISKFAWDIDYDYYIEAANKLLITEEWNG